MEVLKRVLWSLLFLSLPLSASLRKFEDRFFLNGCHIFSWEGARLLGLPGFLCAPLNDGRVISGSETTIRMLRPDQSVDWEVPVLLHHQLKLSEDGRHILALGSEVVSEKGMKVRYDEFVVLSLDGKVLARNSFRNLGKEFLDDPVDPAFASFFGQAKRERSHFNSISRIERSSEKHPSLREGNIIVNGLDLGVFILTPDLATVVHHFKLPSSLHHQVHDVQVLPEGDLLFFNNRDITEGQRFRHSALQVVDVNDLSVTYSFTGEKNVPFYSSHCGGVQRLDDEYYFISHMLNGSYLFSRKNGKVIRSVHEPYFQFGQLWLIQNLRLIELSKTFRRAWKI